MATSKPAEGVSYTRSTADLDLENRLPVETADSGYQTVQPADQQSSDGFVGVSVDYANYANDTDKPLASEGAGFKVAEDVFNEVSTAGESSGKHSVMPDPVTGPVEPGKTKMPTEGPSVS